MLNVKKILLWGAVICLCLPLQLGWAAPKRIGVLPIQNLSSNRGANLGSIVESEIITRLVNNSNYTLVERGYLTNILNELGYDLNTGYTDDIYDKVAKSAGLDYILTGQIVQTTITEQYIPFLGNQIKAKVGVRMVLVDKNNATRLFDETQTDTVSVSDWSRMQTSEEAMFVDAGKGAVKKLMQKFEDYNPIIGMVVGVVDGNIYTDLGRSDNVKVGDRLTIYREGAPLLDNAGNIITVPKKIIAVVEVKAVEAEASICNRSGGVQRGDKVKRGIMKK